MAAVLAAGAPASALGATPPPAVPNAAAAIVVDGRNGEVMFAKRAGEQRPIASTTKLMTALLTLERTRPKEVFTAAAYDAAPVESQIGLAPGEQMTVADLLEALLLESANDAAVTLAEGVSGTREAFVADMNARAEELGLEDTSYANPIGFDDPLNHSTARDLAVLARELLARRRFARVVDLPLAELESGARPRVIDNRNTLVAAYPFVSGVKTGHTLGAGYVLVGSAQRPGRREGDLGGDGRAERGGARRGHAQAAALGARALQPRARGLRPQQPAGDRLDRASRREGRSWCPPAARCSRSARARTCNAA